MLHKALNIEVLKPIRKSDGELAENLTPVMDFACPSFRNVLSSQEQSFIQSVLRGKTRAACVNPAVLAIKALDRVAGVEHPADRRGILENRSDHVPVIHPAFHGIWVDFIPFFLNLKHIHMTRGLFGGMVNGFQVGSKGLFVSSRNM